MTFDNNGSREKSQRKLSISVDEVSASLVGSEMTGCRLTLCNSFRNSVGVSAAVSNRLILKSPPTTRAVLGAHITSTCSRVERIFVN